MKQDRLRRLPRHIRTALPLLPSGPGGIHEFKIARRPEPDKPEISKRPKRPKSQLQRMKIGRKLKKEGEISNLH